MKGRKLYSRAFFIVAFFCHVTSYASVENDKNASDVNKAIIEQWLRPSDVYLGLTAGGSFSTSASIYVSPVFWDPSPEGYNNNLGESEVLGAAIGYVMSPLFRVELGTDHRNSFEYSKYLSTPTSSVWGPRNRYFNLSNTTVMATLFANGSGISERLNYQGNGFIIDPFVGAGLGAAFNTVDNMHSNQVVGNKSFSIMTAGYTTREFAYQFSVGFEVKTDKKLAFGVGYRYLNAGHFQSNNYIADNPDNVGVTSGVVVPPWSGIFATNEVYATLKYAIG